MLSDIPNAVSLFDVFPPAIIQRSSVTAPQPLSWINPSSLVDPATWEKAEAFTQLNEFAALPADWDGEGAPRIAPETIAAARSFIASFHGAPLPAMIPHPAGTLTIEWESAIGAACLEVGRDRFSFYARRREGSPALRPGSSAKLGEEASIIAAIVNAVLFPRQPSALSQITFSEGVERHGERYPA